MREFDWLGMWMPRWPPWEVALRAAIAYLFLQVMLRLVGRKELGRYANFNVAVLILISVTLRQALVGEDTSLTNGMVALATIVGLDVGLSYVTSRSRRAADLIEGPVRELVRDGTPIMEELARTRVSLDELHAELRQYGRTSFADVAHAYMERSGRITFLFRDQRPVADARAIEKAALEQSRKPTP